MPSHPPLARTGLSALVFVLLSGCASNNSPTDLPPEGSMDDVDDAAEGVLDSNCPGCAPAKAGRLEPQRHYHHYWGDLEQVVVFEKIVEYRPSPSAAAEGDPSAMSPEAATANYDRGCRTVGYAEWDLEDDGDDVGGDQISPVNPDTKKADSVFQGTDYLLFESLGGSFNIRWKPSDSSGFLPPICGGIPVTEARPFLLKLRMGEADPPHQFFTSRWRFLSEPDYLRPPSTEGVYLPNAATGSFHVRITAHNGGELFLDPAHRDLYANSPAYDLGCGRDVTAERQVIAEPYYKPRGDLNNMTFAFGKIVPLQTGKVRVKLSVEYTGPVAGTTWDLWYHGSSTSKFAPATFVEMEGNDRVYEVADPQGAEADPPYESFSLWRFELHPKGPGGGPTIFSGKAHVCGTAFRNPEAPPLT